MFFRRLLLVSLIIYFSFQLILIAGSGGENKDCPRLYLDTVEKIKFIEDYKNFFKGCKIKGGSISGYKFENESLPAEISFHEVIRDVDKKFSIFDKEFDENFYLKPKLVSYLVIKCPCWKRLNRIVVIGTSTDSKQPVFMVVKEYDLSNMKKERIKRILFERVSKRAGVNPVTYVSEKNKDVEVLVWKGKTIDVIGVLQFDDYERKTPLYLSIYYIIHKGLNDRKKIIRKMNRFCPKFTIKDIPFGKGEDVFKKEKLKCLWDYDSGSMELPYHFGRLYPRSFILAKNYGVATPKLEKIEEEIRESLLQLHTVSCSCWKGIKQVKLYYFKTGRGMKLGLVEKIFDTGGIKPAIIFKKVVKAIKRRVKRSPKIYTTSYIIQNELTNFVVVKLRYRVAFWRGKRIDVFASANKDEGVEVIYFDKSIMKKANRYIRKKKRKILKEREGEY